mgnify:FL=1
MVAHLVAASGRSMAPFVEIDTESRLGLWQSVKLALLSGSTTMKVLALYPVTKAGMFLYTLVPFRAVDIAHWRMIRKWNLR